jgi:hypothetical protein
LSGKRHAPRGHSRRVAVEEHGRNIAAFPLAILGLSRLLGMLPAALAVQAVAGGGISSGLDEVLTLVQPLNGREAPQQVQRFTQYYPRPPVTSAITPATTCPLDEVAARR